MKGTIFIRHQNNKVCLKATVEMTCFICFLLNPVKTISRLLLSHCFLVKPIWVGRGFQKLVDCMQFFFIRSLSWVALVSWSLSLLYLIHTHFCCCNACWEFRSHCDSERFCLVAWSLASIACVEAYAFDFERLRLFEYVGERPK